MAMGEKVLRKKAKKRELKGSLKNKINPEHVPALEELLHDVYVISRPKESDYYNRKDLVRIFNVIAKEIYGKSDDIPVVEQFGSFLMDIFSAKSDLDLSVNFSNNTVDFPKEKKIQTLRKFAKKLYALQRKGHVSSVHPILTAKVPILKIVDRGTGIECDISIENRDGIVKSQIVRMISSIDDRFQMLSFLTKAWAKAHDINSSKDRTLNSLSIILLVAFHLQTRDPPILPPFSAIFKDGTDPLPVGKIVNNFLNYGKRNKESLGELFVALLNKLLSVETLWAKGLCASTYEGSWILKTWDSKFGCISVEDFTDRSQNVARAVGKKQVKKIYERIHLSIHYVFGFINGKIEGTKLRELLFGRDLIPAPVDKCTPNLDKSTSLDPIQMKKKKRPAECLEETDGVSPLKKKKMAKGCGGTMPNKGWEGTLPTKGWEGAPPTKGWGGTPPTNSWEGALPTNNWGGAPPTKGWGGTLPTNIWGGALPTKGWGGAPPTNSWGGAPPTKGWGGAPPTNSWEGTPSTKGWGETVSIKGWGETPPAKGWGGALPTKSWGGAPSTKGWGETLSIKGWGEMLSTKGWGGTPPTKSWGGAPPTKSWGGTPFMKGWGETPSIKGWGETPSTKGWGETPSTGWGGAPPTKNWGGTPSTKGWGETPPTKGWGGASPTKSWGGTPPTNGWGGTPTEGWGGTPTVGWGGMQQAVVADSIWRKEMQSAEGWAGTNQANSEIKLHVNSPSTSKIPFQTFPSAAPSSSSKYTSSKLQFQSYPKPNKRNCIKKSSRPLLQPHY